MRPKKSHSKAKSRGAKPVVNDKLFNLHHPELADKVEYQFTSGGIKYYSFCKDTEARYGRYIIMANMVQEVSYRMDRETLRTYITRTVAEIDGTKGAINIGNALAFLGQMLTLTDMSLESDTMYRLASAVYFDETENLKGWDPKYNAKKIQGWKEDGTLDFFYKRPFAELINLKGTSQTDLRDFLQASEKLKEDYKRVLSSEILDQDSKSSMMQE